MLSFIFIFGIICSILDSYAESYRSFNSVRKNVRRMSRNKPIARLFLAVHFSQKVSLDRRPDTFRWINKLIALFWPHVSHIAHHELNAFIKESKKTKGAFPSKAMRIIHAISRHLDGNVVSIEHCQLGEKSPFFKKIRALVQYEDCNDVRNKGINVRQITRLEPVIQRKSLIYDLSIAYEGNMKILLTYRYLCCCSSRLGLRDVFIHMNCRLGIGPIHENLPLIERFDFSLLDLPEFGYKGIAIVELARLRVARRSINRLIKGNLLYPKKLSVDISRFFLTGSDADPSESPKRLRMPSHKKDQHVGRNDGNRAAESEGFCSHCCAKFLICSCLCSNLCLSRLCCQANKIESAKAISKV